VVPCVPACPPPPWQRPSPLPQHFGDTPCSRGPKPPASARPAPGGRFPPAGSGAGLCCSRTCRSTGHRRARAGETQCVSCSRPEWRWHFVAVMAGAIAPATALRWHQDQPGAKAPGQRPPRPRRALLARRVGRWPLLFPDPPVYGALSRPGGGNAVRFLFPPALTKAVPPLQRQGPSPLPQRYAAPLASRGPKPPAIARPALGPGASPPPGRALAFVARGETIFAAPSRWGGGNAVRFLCPARRGGEIGDSPLNGTGRPRLPTEGILVTTSPGACVLFSAWSCDRRKEIQMR
jgi:hypothetical protein